MQITYKYTTPLRLVLSPWEPLFQHEEVEMQRATCNVQRSAFIQKMHNIPVYTSWSEKVPQTGLEASLTLATSKRAAYY